MSLAPSVKLGLRHDGGGRRDRGRHGRRAAQRTSATRANAILDRLAVRIHQLGLTLFESPALVARWVHPARSPHAAGTAAVDARRRADQITVWALALPFKMSRSASSRYCVVTVDGHCVFRFAARCGGSAISIVISLVPRTRA